MAAIRKKAAVKKAAAKQASPRKAVWLDDKGGVAIDEYARKLKSFMKAMADGIVTSAELKEQEERVVALLREVEPRVPSALHGRVTDLLCELTAYDIMRVLHSLQSARKQAKFQG